MDFRMSRHKLFYIDAKLVRDSLNEVIGLSQDLQHQEYLLIEKLRVIDRRRFFVRYGYRSLRGFLVHCLYFSRTQAQRIVTEVRRKNIYSDDDVWRA